jgi:hypothetical protein
MDRFPCLSTSSKTRHSLRSRQGYISRSSRNNMSVQRYSVQVPNQVKQESKLERHLRKYQGISESTRTIFRKYPGILESTQTISESTRTIFKKYSGKFRKYPDDFRMYPGEFRKYLDICLATIPTAKFARARLLGDYIDSLTTWT